MTTPVNNFSSPYQPPVHQQHYPPLYAPYRSTPYMPSALSNAAVSIVLVNKYNIFFMNVVRLINNYSNWLGINELVDPSFNEQINNSSVLFFNFII